MADGFLSAIFIYTMYQHLAGVENPRGLIKIYFAFELSIDFFITYICIHYPIRHP
jgi:hypothetical protein